MIFVYEKWDKFCQQLKADGFSSIPACAVASGLQSYLVLKHDVEMNVPKAHIMACIEHKYGHCGSYYIQAYLMQNEHNVLLMKEMQAMGHEISYHYDVMDSCHGNLDASIKEFEKNRFLFETCGFHIKTVCQHGNPLIERVGYTSNRDLFRSEKVRALYPDISDILVNFKTSIPTEFQYYSDAGRLFRLIYDPINNDRVDSDDKNIAFKNLEVLLKNLSTASGNIISTHPHRWTNSAFTYQTKSFLFKVVKEMAKSFYKIPIIRMFMNRYYYVAKRF